MNSSAIAVNAEFWWRCFGGLLVVVVVSVARSWWWSRTAPRYQRGRQVRQAKRATARAQALLASMDHRTTEQRRG